MLVIPECLLVTAVVGSVLRRHDGDEVDEFLHSLVIKATRATHSNKISYYDINLSFRFLNSCRQSSSSNNFSTEHSLLLSNSSIEADDCER